MSNDAIVVTGLTKHFKKRATRRDYSTLKTELVRILTGRPRVVEPWKLIESLKSVDLKVPRGKTLGIIGRNGSGKSTLLKLITGIYTPTSGTVRVEGRVSALLDLGAGFHPDFTGRENILINGIILGMTRAEVKARMEEIITFAELGDFIDEPVRTYSTGMFMRLAFAVATHVDPQILIIDEILAVGDDHFQRKSLAKMMQFKEQGKTIVLVTHDLGTVMRWCDLAAWLDGGVVRQLGEPAAVVAAYRQAVSAAEAQQEQTGASALSTPGLALPVEASPNPELGPFRLHLMRLLDVDGAEVDSVASDGRLEVTVEWSATPGSPIALTIELRDAEGAKLFSTTLDAGRSVATGSARLSIPRLGVGEGRYQLAASIHPPDAPAAQSLTTSLIVTAHAPGSGLVRPAHVWSLDVGGEAQARSS